MSFLVSNYLFGKFAAWGALRFLVFASWAEHLA